MFEILTSVLLLSLILVLIYYLLVQVIPKQALVVLGGAFLLAIILVSFFIPSYGPTAFLWEIVSLPLKPMGLAIVLIFMSVLRIKKDKIEKPAPTFLWVTLIVLIISSNPLIAYQLAKLMEQEAVNIEIKKQGICLVDCPAVGATVNSGAIVLLGAGTTEPNIPYRTQVQLTDQGDRLLYTATLYQEQTTRGNFPRVIICAPPRTGLDGNEDQLNEAQDISRILQRLGIPRDVISLEMRGVHLHMHAVEVKQILTQAGISSTLVTLVTSGIRLRRAAQTFREEGINVIPRPSNFYTFQGEGSPKRKLSPADLLPSIRALQITTQVVEEYFATIYYFLRGWLSPVVY
ncbi:YdcF family protein [Spirulina major CS-329]|uniref:YdcF family protein n=1 Tax=Spirulina TaxID=1154 RepID=UPI00232B8C11|nr:MULTISPECIES: YdcF family protein [Spirulina]MDB9497002.1 YdcF family protein [Spirulina subsalsa CS-330]MDB9503391.1 YdcF family protein [Spirulina major CS-329]